MTASTFTLVSVMTMAGLWVAAWWVWRRALPPASTDPLGHPRPSTAKQVPKPRGAPPRWLFEARFEQHDPLAPRCATPDPVECPSTPWFAPTEAVTTCSLAPIEIVEPTEVLAGAPCDQPGLAGASIPEPSRCTLRA